jgi:hypothetical protein
MVRVQKLLMGEALSRLSPAVGASGTRSVRESITARQSAPKKTAAEAAVRELRKWLLAYTSIFHMALNIGDIGLFLSILLHSGNQCRTTDCRISASY